MRSRSRLVVALAAASLCVVAAGCGGDDAVVTGDTTTTAAAATTTTTAEDTSETSAPAGDTTRPEFSGADSEAFCARLVELDASDSLDTAFDVAQTPAEMERSMTEARGLLDELAGMAPAEISDDVETMASLYGGLVDFFAEYDFDMEAIGTAITEDPTLLEDERFAPVAGDSAEMEALAARLEAYGVDVCGLAPEG